MNEILPPWKATATVAIVGFNAALAVANWPVNNPAYVTSHSIPTFSFFERSISPALLATSNDFAQEIASIFASLSDGQVPLGAEFEAVWDANADSLYQS